MTHEQLMTTKVFCIILEADIHLRLPSGLAGQTKDWDTTKSRLLNVSNQNKIYMSRFFNSQSVYETTCISFGSS